ncbi:MAG: 16S rRNA (adenine(1518)-N(6)/adenine(1519)-N(6))-dimethyltransferase RsmA [Pirellulales bacterium]|nr:16S rRNA (adenine(1518)-N(6)/adenine(1519)-N(6))-dimethyltransferase RsmA [Pirellulales bacterium]
MSTGSARNQTLSYLMRTFKRVGLEPSARHGQNFLIDLNLQRLLLESAELAPTDVVLEVGTGTGALSVLMAERAAAIVTVEIDRHLAQVAQEQLAGAGNVVMLVQDALRNKNNISDAVLEAVRAQLAVDPARRLKLVANLPYCVATPIISNLLSTDVTPVLMTVTIQKELADRIVAVPSTKDYSALSIWIQCQCHTEIVRVLPPEAFWPRPKVHSAIVRIRPDEALRAAIPDREFFHEFVRALFFHRRKFLRSVLVAAFKNRLEKPEVDEVLATLEFFTADTRAEQLDVPTILRLCEAFRLRLAADAT